jgi:hypothetical protein
MNKRILNLFFAIIFINISLSVYSQEIAGKPDKIDSVLDSLKKNGVIFNGAQKKPEIVLSTGQAVKYLQQRYQVQYWNDTRDPLRLALGRLVYEASHPPYDSSKYILKTYPYDSLSIPWDKFYIWEPLRLKIPVISHPEFTSPVDSLHKADTNKIQGVSDSLRPELLNVPKPFEAFKPVTSLKDTIIMVVIDTLGEVTSTYRGFPFRSLNFPYQTDSIQIAVRSLLKYVEERDSSIVIFTGVDNILTPVWMNTRTDKVTRYWLKNELSDSVTVWIGNPMRNTFGLYLEQGVSFKRPVKQGNYSDAKINIKSLDNSKLLDVQKIIVKSQYWKYRSEAAFIFSQTALTNWVKGGENSLSTAMDITGYADYTNKPLKLSSNNFIRLKLGFLKSGANPVRKNLDLIETNSKLNHKAFGRFDFSGIMLFKTQVAQGKIYSKDINNEEVSTLVSKFMNPAILTIGLGLDYKPDKKTSLNFSPLSYKGTFVTDTAHIDQTKYGIPHNRKSLNEPGVSFMITNEFSPFKTVTITNRLQLFTNYVHNPQNIDVDWELIAVAKLNWFTDVRFNTHLIFDDDTKTKVHDGTRKTARIQFKEILGFSFIFRF